MVINYFLFSVQILYLYIFVINTGKRLLTWLIKWGSMHQRYIVQTSSNDECRFQYCSNEFQSMPSWYFSLVTWVGFPSCRTVHLFLYITTWHGIINKQISNAIFMIWTNSHSSRSVCSFYSVQDLLWRHKQVDIGQFRTKSNINISSAHFLDEEFLQKKRRFLKSFQKPNAPWTECSSLTLLGRDTTPFFRTFYRTRTNSLAAIINNYLI